MRQTFFILSLSLSLAVWAGCSSSEEEPPAATPATETSVGAETMPMAETPAPAEADAMAVAPDATKLKAHSADHIKYPATRAQILEACAQTNEFSAGEQKWISDKLPEGTYNSADEVNKALGL